MLTIILCTAMLHMAQPFEIIDYSHEPYALIPLEAAYANEKNETLFHIFNVTHLEEKFEEYEFLRYATDHSDIENKKLTLLADKCREYLNQLTVHRSKRGINFLGTIIKFVTGTPDHDDMELVQNKLNDLIENNNRLAVINSKLQRNIDYLTKSSEYHLEILFEWLARELDQIIQTINLAKVGILNTAVLNLDEINEIIKKEKGYDAPLMEILEHAIFKILQVNSVYVMLIRYPKIDKKCMLYKIRPVELESGKLKLEKNHGIHTIGNVTRSGTYLLLFNNSVLIDNQNFTNDADLVSDFLQRNKPSQYEILDVIESLNNELKIPTLTTIEKIPIEFENHPVRSILICIVILVIIMIALHYGIKLCKLYNDFKIRKENAHVRSLFN